MAKAPRRLPATHPVKNLFQHSPNVITKFGPEDLHTSYYPLPGIDFHNNPQLASWVEKYGVAPDVLFRQGLAAPPLGVNTSGLRHYDVSFDGDPAKILNLDVPVSVQQQSVREALSRLGVSDRPDAPGYRDDTAEAIWLDALRQHGGYNNARLSELDPLVDPSLEGPNNLQNIAEWVASGDPAADALRNELAPIVLARMGEAGIPAASRMGAGFGAGTGFAPTTAGKSPWMELLEDQASSARANGDIARAQELENQLAVPDDPEDAKQFFRDNMPSAPTEGTREYKVFDPNAVTIRRIASILAAMGLGGAEANADDRYGDRTSGFSNPPPLPPQEYPAGNQGSSLLDAFAIAPQAWAGEYAAGGVGGSAAQLPEIKDHRSLAEYAKNYLVDEDLIPSDVQAFQGELPPEHAEFVKNFNDAMQMRVVHLGDSVTTPEAYLNQMAGEYAGRGFFSPTAVDNAKRILQGLPLVLPSDPIQADTEKQLVGHLRDGLLDQMRETLPSGGASYGWEPGATPEQIAEFRKKDPTGIEARWMLTPEGQQAFQAERALNLLSTFQNGRHRPVFADRGSRYIGMLASAMPFPRGEGNDVDLLSSSRFNTPQGRLNESLYWWNRGVPDGTAMNTLTGAKYPSISSTTMEGIGTKMDTTDHWIPYFNQQGFEQSLFNNDLSPHDYAKLQNLRDNQLRAVTPHNPPNANPEELRRLRKDLRDFQMNSRGWANAHAPLYTKYIPDTAAWVGERHMPPGYKPPGPRFLSQAEEMGANLPRNIVDLQTVGMAAGGLLSGLVRSGVHAVPGVVAKTALDLASDLPQELGTEATMAAVNARNESGEAAPGIFEPQKRSLVAYTEGPRMGFPVPADDPNYAYYLDQATKTRENMLRDLLDRGTKLYGRELAPLPDPMKKAPSTSPNVFFGS